MKFTKMQAVGNDYIYIDAINQKLNNLPELSIFLSERHFGVGSDGIVLICPSEKADFRMRMFNADGSEGEMCGNAIRSVGKYVYEKKLTRKTKLTIETLAGIKNLQLFVENEKVVNICANIGKPIFDMDFIEKKIQILDREFLLTKVSWGNPHVSIFMEDVQNFDVATYGKEIENRLDLFPERTNVTFAKVESPTLIHMREWERGSGETLGCGTGGATAAVTGIMLKQCERKVTIIQPGGPIEIYWEEGTDELYMTGPSTIVFEGNIDVSHIM